MEILLKILPTLDRNNVLRYYARMTAIVPQSEGVFKNLKQTRLCDLSLCLESNPLFIKAKKQLLAELARVGILFKPHFWVSDEWYSPD